MRRAPLAAAALLLTAGLGLSGCSSSGPHLTAHDAYMPQPVTADVAGAYLVIRNTGGTADTLTSVTSDLSPDVTMHKTSGTSMRSVNSLPVPAGGTLRLERGGNHLMFMKLSHKPREGEKVSVKLHFARSHPITLAVPVKAATYTPRK